jgi:hypothetical protein
MTTEEAKKRLRGHTQRSHELLAKIAVEARAVVPVLLDSGRANSAKALQELLFQMDAMEQEIKELLLSNPEALFALLENLGGPHA